MARACAPLRFVPDPLLTLNSPVHVRIRCPICGRVGVPSWSETQHGGHHRKERTLHGATRCLSVSRCARRSLPQGHRPPFSTKGAYLHSMSVLPDNPGSIHVWDNALPPKCKFFLWLLHLDKFPTRDRLFHCHMTDKNACPFCSLTETQEHLFLHCTHATHVWVNLGIPEVSSFSSLHDI